MIKTLLASFFVCSASAAFAQSCPDFYRFVDFGLTGADGVTYRGGSVFRAEGLDGRSLLLADRTTCRLVRDIATDGHGNPIPVVASVSYKPEAIDPDLMDLHLFRVDDPYASADMHARDHRRNLAQPNGQRAQGSNFLCTLRPDPQTISCQFVSPFPNDAALVVYCDAQHCSLPQMLVTDQIVVNATWSRHETETQELETIAGEIFGKIQTIHDFLKPLSAAL